MTRLDYQKIDAKLVEIIGAGWGAAGDVYLHAELQELAWSTGTKSAQRLISNRMTALKKSGDIRFDRASRAWEIVLQPCEDNLRPEGD
jgi:hypothetical protein